MATARKSKSVSHLTYRPRCSAAALAGRQGLLERDAENSYLVGDDLDAGPMEQLLGSSMMCKDARMSRAQDAQERPTYRIAVGPQQATSGTS